MLHLNKNIHVFHYGNEKLPLRQQLQQRSATAPPDTQICDIWISNHDICSLQDLLKVIQVSRKCMGDCSVQFCDILCYFCLTPLRGLIQDNAVNN